MGLCIRAWQERAGTGPAPSRAKQRALSGGTPTAVPATAPPAAPCPHPPPSSQLQRKGRAAEGGKLLAWWKTAGRQKAENWGTFRVYWKKVLNRKGHSPLAMISTLPFLYTPTHE